MLEMFFILIMGVLSRQAGGDLGARHLDRFKITWLPEALFAIPFGIIGVRAKRHEVSEFVAGMGAGVAILLAYHGG